MNKNDIHALFDEVVVNDGDFFRSDDDDEGLIWLKGSFCSDELREIARVLDEVNHGTPQDKEVKRIQNLNVKGFTVKDIKVIYFLLHEDSKKYSFSFFIMKDGVDWDFYYAKSDQRVGNWWPTNEKDDFPSICEFIPYDFIQTCENIYQCSDTNEETINFLKLCGFTVVSYTTDTGP
jgi:hypothetical protein